MELLAVLALVYVVIMVICMVMATVPTVNTSPDLLDNCNPKFMLIEESCGCTLTRANITARTAADMQADYFKEMGMDKIVAQTKELRMTGVKQNALMDLLMSRMKPGKQGILGSDQHGRSVISPFSLIPQRSVINSNYWVIESGEATPGATYPGQHAGAWRIKIINEAGPFASSLRSLEKYFLPGKYVTVLTKDVADDTGRTLQFKVLGSLNADSGGVQKANIDLEPPYTAAGWAALTGDEQDVFAPERGVVINMSNSVSNYESWCYQYPAEINLKLRDFWWQTIRSTWCYNDEYVKALTAPLTSDFFKKFRTLQLAEQRKRQGMQEERDFFNTVFYGQRINEVQTQEDYTDLPQVVDPNNTSCLLEYKANTLGVRTQLDECQRVTDFQNAPLDIDLIKDQLYGLRRHRGLSGLVEIDMMGDRFTYMLWQTAFIQYVKDRYSIDTTRFYTPGQKLVFNNQVLWNYDRFEFPEDGVIVNFFHDDYFDDHLSAFPDEIKSRGRQLWVIDWSDIDIAVSDVKSVNRQTNIADDLYNCVITPNMNHYQLQSKTLQVQIGDPNRHLIWENFSDECPVLTAAPCVEAS